MITFISLLRTATDHERARKWWKPCVTLLVKRLCSWTVQSLPVTHSAYFNRLKSLITINRKCSLENGWKGGEISSHLSITQTHTLTLTALIWSNLRMMDSCVYIGINNVFTRLIVCVCVYVCLQSIDPAEDGSLLLWRGILRRLACNCIGVCMHVCMCVHVCFTSVR